MENKIEKKQPKLYNCMEIFEHKYTIGFDNIQKRLAQQKVELDLV
jgi:hypothetical protein